MLMRKKDLRYGGGVRVESEKFEIMKLNKNNGWKIIMVVMVKIEKVKNRSIERLNIEWDKGMIERRRIK